MYVTPVQPDNYGWLQVELDNEYLNHIWDCVRSASGQSYKKSLIGHIEKSILLKDKKNKLFKGLLLKLVNDYGNHWSHKHLSLIHI